MTEKTSPCSSDLSVAEVLNEIGAGQFACGLGRLLDDGVSRVRVVCARNEALAVEGLGHIALEGPRVRRPGSSRRTFGVALAWAWSTQFVPEAP